METLQLETGMKSRNKEAKRRKRVILLTFTVLMNLVEETRQRINAIKRLGDDFDEDEDLMMQNNDADQT